LQSKTFNKTISLPKETANSAFVKSPSKGGQATTVSVIIVLPSLARIDCFNSSLFIDNISLVVQFNNLFISRILLTHIISLYQNAFNKLISKDFFRTEILNHNTR